jgi:hypothetical protein
MNNAHSLQQLRILPVLQKNSFVVCLEIRSEGARSAGKLEVSTLNLFYGTR